MIAERLLCLCCHCHHQSSTLCSAETKYEAVQ